MGHTLETGDSAAVNVPQLRSFAKKKHICSPFGTELFITLAYNVTSHLIV